MPRKHKPKRDKPLPPFEEMPPIDPDVFIVAVNFAMNAASGNAITDDPTKAGINLVEENGSVSELRFTDIPMNRAMLALKERFAGDSAMFSSAATRMFALGKVLEDPRLSKWIKHGDDSDEVHEAVIETAATIRLDANGEFPLDKFILQVEELTESKYKDDF